MILARQEIAMVSLATYDWQSLPPAVYIEPKTKPLNAFKGYSTISNS